jgi:competence/damage-inducible protein CinA-like protein
MIAEILAIGTEVVDGDVINTNAAWLASQMSQRGYEVKFHSAVPDEEALMLEALTSAARRAQVVLVTGGLGPTIDDITLEVAAKFFAKKLVMHEESLKRIQTFFKKLQRPMTPNQEKQALLPDGCTPLPNDRGTAPGVYILHEGVAFAFFPGIPWEMQEMFKKQLSPLLLQSVQGEHQARKTLRCFGAPEGQLDAQLRPLLESRTGISGVQVGFRVCFPIIDIRLKATRADAREAQGAVDRVSQEILEKVGDYVFGEGEDTLEEALGRLLKERGLTLASAESCTGGLLAHLITNVPGASDYFLEGVVSYSNQAKLKILGVREKTLVSFGAVSREVALEMAQGICKISGAKLGVAVTGIAGPSGGTEKKPVGTVHIAVVHPQGEWEKAYIFPFGRERFKQLTAATALDRMRRIILGSPEL